MGHLRQHRPLRPYHATGSAGGLDDSQRRRIHNCLNHRHRQRHQAEELAYRYINSILDPETQVADARHILISRVVKGAPVDQSLYDQPLLPSPDDFNKLLDLN